MINKQDEYSINDPYLVNFNNYFHQKRLKNSLSIIKILPAKSKILDIGCGKGYFTKEYAVNNNEVLGVDYSESAIAFAKRNFYSERVNFLLMDVKDLLNLGVKFDIIIANNLIEHIDNVNDFFKNCHNLLNKNGFLVISTPNPYSYEGIIRLICKMGIKYRHDNHICEYSISQMKQFFLKNGFNLKKIIAQFNFSNKFSLKKCIINIINKFFSTLRLKSLATTLFYLVQKK